MTKKLILEIPFPETMEVQMVKVYSKTNPERVVNIIANRQPDESIKWLLPEDVLSSISYYFGLLEDHL